MPKIIDRRTLTTAKRKAEFDKTCKRYSKQQQAKTLPKDHHKFDYLGTFHYSASQITAVEDMIEDFRKARRYSKKRTLQIGHHSQILEPQMRVLDIPNRNLHDPLTVVLG